MSIVIALAVVLVVAGLIAKFYPKPTPKVEEKATWDFTPKLISSRAKVLC